MYFKATQQDAKETTAQPVCRLAHNAVLDAAVSKLCITKQDTALDHHQGGPLCNPIRGIQRLNLVFSDFPT